MKHAVDFQIVSTSKCSFISGGVKALSAIAMINAITFSAAYSADMVACSEMVSQRNKLLADAAVQEMTTRVILIQKDCPKDGYLTTENHRDFFETGSFISIGKRNVIDLPRWNECARAAISTLEANDSHAVIIRKSIFLVNPNPYKIENIFTQWTYGKPLSRVYSIDATKSISASDDITKKIRDENCPYK